MVKKRLRDNKWFMYLGVPAGIVSICGALVLCARVVVAYADLPQEVNKTKEDVGEIRDYIKEQRISQSMMEKIIAKDEQEIISQDGRYFWDSKLEKWRLIKDKK